MGSKELPLSSSKYEMTKIDDYHSLLIRQVAPLDADEYVAKAVNAGGNRTSRANIVVKCMYDASHYYAAFMFFLHIFCICYD